MNNKSKSKSKLQIGGIFHVQHIRKDKIIDTFDSENMFVNEGLVYALNVAYAAMIAGVPSPSSNFYIGLSTANRSWTAGDTAANVNTLSNELEDYSQAARPAWNPQTLATVSSIELNDTGFEAEYTLTADVSVYGAFLINAAAKDGSSDGNAGVLLSAGSNFPAVRNLFIGDTFRVGYILKTENKV